MKKTMLACATLALCSPVLAQSYITTPNGGLAAEGPQYTYIFGWFADGRFQMADGNHRGKSYTMSRISFRLDSRAHTTLTADGRTWTNITLNISETSNFDQMDRTWSNNITSTPTAVFNSKWSWPSQTGTPLLKPDSWGGLKGQLSFSFSKPWVYSGRDDILMDYTFRGGVLASNNTWTSARGVPFYLDSEYINTVQQAGSFERLPATLNQCADSGVQSQVTTATAYMQGYSYAHGASSPQINLRNHVVLSHYSYYTAANAPVVHAIGFGGIRNGVDIKARCNKLYVDLTKPTVMMTFKTLNAFGYSGIMNWQVPWRSQFAGLELFIQGAWSDSKTNEFSLTGAVNVTLPNRLPPAQLPRYKTMYGHDLNSSLGAINPVTSGLYFPYTRYQVK